MDSPLPDSPPKYSKRKQATTTKGRNKSSAAEKKQAANSRAKVNNVDVPQKKDTKTSASKEDHQATHEDEENIVTSTDQVSVILSKLGEEIQQRMKAKRQRLESCFDTVRTTPDAILESITSQTDERKKMLNAFKADSEKVMKDVENVLSIQMATEDKFSKMMLATQKQFDQIKDALNGTITGLNDAVGKFINETDSMENKHGEESKQQLQHIRQELAVLQKKILNEGQQEEAENIKTTLQLV